MNTVFSNAHFIKPSIPFDPVYTQKNHAPMFRRTVTLDDTENARLYVCGLGFAYYYINGEAVSPDLFTSAVSQYDKTLWYHVYDVSHLLRKGENTFAVLCGNGWYNEDFKTVWKHSTADYRDLPKFILRLSVNETDVLVSDGAWKCAPDSATYFNALRSGEYFDASLYDENWARPEFDDGAWAYAAVDTAPPKGIFRECLCEPIRAFDVSEPQSVARTESGSFVYDMGLNRSGYIRLTASGKSGQMLTIRYGERLNEAGHVDHKGLLRFFPESEFQTDRFICSGKSVTWSPKFTYHGFRYIEIEGITDPAEITVQAVFVHQAVERRTTFRCSEEALNRLFDAGIRSSYSNMFYQLTDCPTREKMGWTNDAHISCEQFCTNFKIERLLDKWRQDIYDAMRDDGMLPGVIPTPGYGYEWGNGPLSDGILFELPYRLWFHSGNPAPLIDSLPYFDRYLRFLKTKEDEKGLIEFGLGDWATVGHSADVPRTIVNAVLQYKYCGITKRAADLAGERTLSQHYGAELNACRERILKTWLTSDGRCTVPEMSAVAMLIYYGLYESLEPLKAQLQALIEQNGFHHHCGMIGLRCLYEALEICGLQEYAYRIVTARDVPSYSFWQENGSTTLWEYWPVQRGKEYESRNHHLYSDVLSWLIKAVLGIRHEKTDPKEPELRLAPYFFSSLDYAEGSYETDGGKLSVSWKRNGSAVTLSAELSGNVRVRYGDRVLTEGSHCFDVIN